MNDNTEERVFSEEVEILRELFVSNRPVKASFFHQKYRLSLGQVARTVSKFSDLGILTFTDDGLLLTSYGRSWLTRQGLTYLMTNRVTSWQSVPTEFTHRKKYYHHSDAVESMKAAYARLVRVKEKYDKTGN